MTERMVFGMVSTFFSLVISLMGRMLRGEDLEYATQVPHARTPLLEPCGRISFPEQRVVSGNLRATQIYI